MDNNKDYEVGRGRPPVEHRFKPGQSGNPEGARKRTPQRKNADFRELAIEVANEKVWVVINRRKRRYTKKVAILIQTINDAIAGTPGHRLKALKVLQSIGAFDHDIQSTAIDPAARERFVEQLAAEARRIEKLPDYGGR